MYEEADAGGGRLDSAPGWLPNTRLYIWIIQIPNVNPRSSIYIILHLDL